MGCRDAAQTVCVPNESKEFKYNQEMMRGNKSKSQKKKVPEFILNAKFFDIELVNKWKL